MSYTTSLSGHTTQLENRKVNKEREKEKRMAEFRHRADRQMVGLVPMVPRADHFQ